MNGRTRQMRELTAAERNVVGGGASCAEFFASVAQGTEVGVAVGATVGAIWVMPPLTFVAGAVYGGFVGGFLGGAYYVAGELIDYCF